MLNYLPIYQASNKKREPRRETEREYLIRMARMRNMEDRRTQRRGILGRIGRRRTA
jgi:hypothetical protein